MAAIINFNDALNRHNMAYVGKTPWHGLGQALTEGQPIEVWAEEAGFTHSILRSPVTFNVNGESQAFPNRDVLFHSETGEPLGLVSNRYKVVQPAEVLEFYRDLVDASGDFQLETAGVLDAGQRYWALARYKEEISLAGDIVNPYLLLATSCDGTMATTAQLTSVRVVCNNTLQLSVSDKSAQTIKVPHSTSFDEAAIKSELEVGGAVAAAQAEFEELVNQSIDDRTTIDVFAELTVKRDKVGNVTNEKEFKRLTRELWTSLRTAPGANLESARGTGWGVLNAVTHFVDHKAFAHSDNNRFKSGQMGTGAQLKQRAFDLIKAAA